MLWEIFDGMVGLRSGAVAGLLRKSSSFLAREAICFVSKNPA